MSTFLKVVRGSLLGLAVAIVWTAGASQAANTSKPAPHTENCGDLYLMPYKIITHPHDKTAITLGCKDGRGTVKVCPPFCSGLACGCHYIFCCWD